MRFWTRSRSARAAPASALGAAVALSLLALPATSVRASGPTVTGAGSTWVQIALDQWRSDIARQGYAINYQGVGSSAGREFYIINQVDFAATEIPFEPGEVSQLQSEHKSYQYLPDVAGGTSLMYNLHSPSGARISNLHLDAGTAARIFTGDLTSWQDPAIAALNPGVQISETTVTPVIRSDGSGTSAQFSLYLADQAANTWNAFVARAGCPAPCSLWPPFPGSTQQKGSDGVANFISNSAIGAGAIGYVEAGYAFGRGFPVASLKNVSGNFAQPTSDSVATALTHALLNPDLTQNLTGVYRAPEPSAYPMSSYSYMVTQTSGFDPAKGAVLGAWIIYFACAGQREAAPLGYSPLPPNLVRADFDAVQRIPGAPTPPPIDREHCSNPTVAAAAGGRSGSAPGSAGPSGAAASGGGGRAGASNLGGPGAAAAGAAPGAGAAAGAAGGAGAAEDGAIGDATLPGTRVVTLDDTQRQASFALAERIAGLARPPSVTASAAAGVVILLLTFLPMLLRRAGPGTPLRRLITATGRGGRHAP